MMSRRGKSVFVVVLAAFLTLFTAVPAWAHATLVGSNPSDGAVVADAPTQIALTYDESVGTAAGAVKILAPDGSRVDTNAVTSSDGGRTVVAALRTDLKTGTYTILWRVTSGDTHAVFGALTFSIGQASATAAGSAAANLANGGKAAEDLLNVTRLLLYAGLVLLVGGLAFLLVLWPAGQSFRAARRTLWTGWMLSAAGSAAGLLLQGPYTEGLSLGSTFDPAVIVEVVGTRYGVVTLLRLLLLAAAAVLLRRRGGIRRPLQVGAAAALGTGLLVTTSLVGHAGTGHLATLALPADVLHLAAAATWIGGLGMLFLVLLRRPATELASVLPRWSRYAAGSVIVLVVTGTFSGWRQVRQWDALFSTGYGMFLLVKVALVAVILALAAFGRAWVRRHYLQPVRDEIATAPATLVYAAGVGDTDIRPPAAPPVSQVRPQPSAGAVTRLRRGVLLEAATALVVLGVTAILVATTPARDTYIPTFRETAGVTGDLQVEVEVDPARSGLNNMHLSYTQRGKAVDVVKATARWTSADGGYVVPAELSRTSLGGYDFQRVQLPAIGTWQLALTTQTSDIDSHTTLFNVPIR